MWAAARRRPRGFLRGRGHLRREHGRVRPPAWAAVRKCARGHRARGRGHQRRQAGQRAPTHTCARALVMFGGVRTTASRRAGLARSLARALVRSPKGGRSRAWARVCARHVRCLQGSEGLDWPPHGLGVVFYPWAQRGVPRVVPLGRRRLRGACAASAPGVLVNASRAARLPLRRVQGTPGRGGWAGYGHLDGASWEGEGGFEGSLRTSRNNRHHHHHT